MPDLRLSVVIPSYNAASFIVDALQSAVEQTRAVAEIIVVDDCSTDGTPSIVGGWPVRLLSTGHRSGPAVARNIGIRAATGDAIAFLDADDLWEPTHCEIVGALLDRHPGAAVAFSRVAGFGSESWVSTANFPIDRAFLALDGLLRDNFVAQPTAVVRRETLLRVGGYDERSAVAFAEDYDLWLRLAAIAPFVGTDHVTARYRTHPMQRSRNVDRYVAARWTARHRVWAGETDAGRKRALGRTIHDEWRRELRGAWLRSERYLFNTLLSQHELVPDSLDLARRWWWRDLLWAPWLIVSTPLRLVPSERLRRAGRRMLSRLFGSGRSS